MSSSFVNDIKAFGPEAREEKRGESVKIIVPKKDESDSLRAEEALMAAYNGAVLSENV